MLHHEGDLLLQPPGAAYTLKSAAQEVILRSRPDVTGQADRWIEAQIYAHYAPSAHEVEMVNAAFAEEEPGEIVEPRGTRP